MMILAWIVLCTYFVRIEGQVAGGVNNADEKDPIYMEKAWKAAIELNKNNTSSEYQLIPIKVLSASSQVVAGTQHVFDVVYGESTCKKTEVEASKVSAANCILRDGGAREIQKVTLWEKPWENFENYEMKKVRNVSPTEQI